MKVIFRSYTDTDYQAFMQMVIKLYNEDPEGDKITEEKINATIKEAKDHPCKVSIKIFMMGHSYAGYAILVYFWSNEYGGDVLHIDELYVEKEFRKRGIATDFLESLVTGEAVGLQLQTTKANQRAEKFYRQQGFRALENNHLFKRI